MNYSDYSVKRGTFSFIKDCDIHVFCLYFLRRMRLFVNIRFYV